MIRPYLLTIVTLVLWISGGIAQTYLHPLAELNEDGRYTYYLDAAGKVTSKSDLYSYVRTAQRLKRKGPIVFETRDRGGKLVERGASSEADPVYKRYEDTYVSFHPNSDTAAFYAYKKGRLHGAYLEFYPNGKAKRIGQHEKGDRVGEWKYFDEAGRVTKVERYKENRPYGMWEEFYPSGALRWQLAFINGLPIGVETYYLENGAVEQRFTYQEQNRSGVYVRYHENGSIAERGDYRNGAKEGVWTANYANGKLHYQGGFNAGERIGAWLILHSSGDTLLNGEYTNQGFTGMEQGFSAKDLLVYRKQYNEGSVETTTLFDATGACMAMAKGDDPNLLSCNDQSLIENWGICLPPTTELDLKTLFAANLPMIQMPGNDVYGVYKISINRRGRVVDPMVLEAAGPMVDDQVIGLLQSQVFQPGNYYAYPARFSVECVVRLVDGEIDLLLGEPYVDDKVLFQQSHVPVQENHAHAAEVLPSFYGGEQALRQWLSSQQRYPEFALEHQISGESIVQFVVEPSGVLSGIAIATNASPVLDYEALRATRRMPLWKSGEKQGKEVRTVNKLPYRFTLR